MTITSCKVQEKITERSEYLMLDTIIKSKYKGKIINFEVYTFYLSTGDFTRYIESLKFNTDFDSSWYNDFKEVASNRNIKWNSNKIKFKDINTSFKINKEIYKKEFKKFKNNNLVSDREIYDKRVVYWSLENRTFKILSVSNVFYNKDKNKAILFSSVYHQGLSAWVFEKNKDKWLLREEKEVAIY
ncbi:hypothetical protein [Olleya sp. R77988]|uniref:hypothetical protein n=1 Tax=Olleya sp. R77988 TaxID=3093875 RepID=UPI0037CB772D